MKPAPLIAEALVEALADCLLQHEHYPSAGTLVPFSEQDASVRRHWIDKAKTAIAGPLAPLLATEASLQQVTAERDEARETQRDLHRRVQKAESFRERHCGGFIYLMNGKRKERQGRRTAEAALATATAEAARLRGEVEAKDRALKIAVDALTWLRAPFRGRSEATRLQMREDAQEALDEIARAATEEGQADG